MPYAGGSRGVGPPLVGSVGVPVRGGFAGEQGPAHGTGVGVSVVGLLLQGLEHDRLKVCGDASENLRRGNHLVSGVGHHDGEGALTRERGLARQRVIGDRSEGVDVGPDVEFLSAGRLFGRHVRWRAAHGQVGRQHGGLGVLGQLHQAEVEHLGHVGLAPTVGDEDVGRLQVAVDQADRVGLGQPGAGLAEQEDRPARRQGAGRPDQLFQAHPGQVFHDVIEDAVVGVAVVVDGDRVGVREPGGRVDFSLEAGQGRGVGASLGFDQLEGAGTLQELVLGHVDLAHPAGADLLEEPILAELLGVVQFGPQAIEDERAVQGQQRADRQEEDVRAGFLGRVELLEDRWPPRDAS